jgi:uncharacterized protein (TIGR02466 family)
MKNTISLFPIKVYKTVYDLDKVEQLKKHVYDNLTFWNRVEGNNPDFIKDGNLCSYQVEPAIHDLFPEETKDFVEWSTNCAKEYWKELDYFDGLEPYVLDMWANFTPKDGWIDSHCHISMPLNAVLYLDASPDQGNIVIENPNDQLLATQPINYKTKFQFEEEIEVRTGDFIIFPGFLKHKVRKNTTDKPRMVLGLNFGAKGFYWANQWVTQPKGDMLEAKRYIQSLKRAQE